MHIAVLTGGVCRSYNRSIKYYMTQFDRTEYDFNILVLVLKYPPFHAFVQI